MFDNLLSNEKGVKKKRGCFITAILVLLGIIVVVAAGIYASGVYSPKNNTDERYVNLMKKDYQTSAFVSKLTEENKNIFNQKVKNSARSSVELFNENGELNVIVFASKGTYFVNNLTLDKNDLVIFYNDFIAIQSYSTKFNVLFSISNCINIDITQNDNVVEYKAIFRFNSKPIKTLAQDLAYDGMNDFYLTLAAEIDLLGTEKVKSASLQINCLTGDDNEYCLNKILQTFDLSTKDLNEFAYLPFEFNKSQNDVWKSDFDYNNGNLIIFKNN